MITSPRSVGLTGLGHYVPQRRLTNQQLEATLDTTDAWIREKIGIRERPIAAEHQAASDLALPAAQQALEDAGVSPRDVDLIVVAVANQDTLLPPTAHWVQARLGARRAAAFDLRAACSGFLYGLVTGAQFVADGTYDTVLLIGVEHHSKMVDYTDRSTAVYFADGAGAAVLQAVPEGRGLLAWDLGTDGQHSGNITIPAGGSRRPTSAETVAQRQHYLRMDGRSVFTVATRMLPVTVRASLSRSGLAPDQVDLVIVHQANVNMIRCLMDNLGLSLDRTFLTLETFGNAAAATLPITLREAQQAGCLHPGDVVVLAAVGAGMSWGSAVLRW